MERLCGDLEKNKKLFGIKFFGDFATIKKTPFLSILGSGTYCPTDKDRCDLVLFGGASNVQK
eukprot:4964373-Ditylum_brightwellii.AAC.1